MRCSEGGLYLKEFILKVLAVVLLLATASSAFPLQTTDGRITVYGMIPTEDGFALDIFSPYTLNGMGIATNLKVEVVDSEDRFIESYTREDVSYSGYHDRALYFFRFDKPATQIKRIRIETPNQDVYSISWSGVPEASTKNITIRLYGITESARNSNNYVYTIQGLRFKRYTLDIRVTNNMNNGLILSPKYFWLLDQFNYGYSVSGEEYKLLPNESVRYTLESQLMSPLSRPKGLLFIPENFSIDLEGWY